MLNTYLTKWNWIDLHCTVKCIYVVGVNTSKAIVHRITRKSSALLIMKKYRL